MKVHLLSPSPMVGEGGGEGKESRGFKEERDFYSGETLFPTSGRFFGLNSKFKSDLSLLIIEGRPRF